MDMENFVGEVENVVAKPRILRWRACGTSLQLREIRRAAWGSSGKALPFLREKERRKKSTKRLKRRDLKERRRVQLPTYSCYKWQPHTDGPCKYACLASNNTQLTHGSHGFVEHDEFGTP
jgi:hypothetical protein